MLATATPAAHWGTIRLSGWGTGGVSPMVGAVGAGTGSRKDVTIGAASCRYASRISRYASADASDSVRGYFGSVVTGASVAVQAGRPGCCGAVRRRHGVRGCAVDLCGGVR